MGIGRNFIFSGILAVSNYVFPILVYPHVSRVLGVQNMGICNFVDSIIDYFVLFSMLGIGAVGIREIASCNGHKDRLNRVFSSIMTVGSVTTLIALVALIVSANVVPALAEYRKLLMFGVIKLVGNFLMLDWLFRGLEDFKYVTYRTILIKMVYVAAVFIWIWHPQDYQLYYLFVCLMVGVNSVFSCLYASKLVRFSVKSISCRPYIKPILIMGLYIFLTSMYTTFNVAYLGFSTDDVQVGYYTTSTKFFNILIGLYMAFTMVMLPRMSALLSEGNMDEFKHRMMQSFDVLFLIGVPLVVFMMCFATQFVELFSGSEYLPAVPCTLLAFPLILVIGIEQILIIQVLIPLKKEKALLIGSAAGATAGLLLNILLVRRLGALGSSIVWFGCEFVVLLVAQYFVERYLQFRIPLKSLLKNIGMYVPMAAILIVVSFCSPLNQMVNLAIGSAVSAIYFCVLQVCILKNQAVLGFVNERILRCRR